MQSKKDWRLLLKRYCPTDVWIVLASSSHRHPPPTTHPPKQNYSQERTDTLRRKAAVDKIIESKKSESEANLTRSEILSLTRTIDMKLQMEDRIAERNVIQAELLLRNLERQKNIEETEENLRCHECNMTTPRSLTRRRLVRRLHVALDRQNNGYVVCDWGCGDFVKSGQDQAEHQLQRCPKRIVGCALECPIKLSQEQWFSSARVTVEDTDAARLKEFQVKEGYNFTFSNYFNSQNKSHTFLGKRQTKFRGFLI